LPFTNFIHEYDYSSPHKNRYGSRAINRKYLRQKPQPLFYPPSPMLIALPGEFIFVAVTALHKNERQTQQDKIAIMVIDQADLILT
jgi:hypothetical protein